MPQDLHATILQMGQLAQRLMAKAADVIISKDVDLALELEAKGYGWIEQEVRARAANAANASNTDAATPATVGA